MFCYNLVYLGIAPETLKVFLEAKFPRRKKNENTLGISDPKLAGNITDLLQIKCTFSGVVPEVIRGIHKYYLFLESYFAI